MKKTLLFAAGFALVALPLSAQKLTEGYITWPASESLHTYVQQWNGGNGTLTVNGETWEDVNFFISRVKPKERFYNASTQVYPGITQYSSTNQTATDKRLAYWVPVGDEARNGVKLNALADGVFDGEVFNMWAYIDHWGDWNAPYGWTPGNFADVAHKNGVAVSGVASVPYGSLSTTWRSCFTGLVSLGGETVGKFLRYFGQDGLGYNSEWGSPGAATLGLTTLHNELQTYMADKDPLWEVMWYAGTGDTGGNYFDTGIGYFTTLYKSASMFLNYNWNSTSYMTSSISTSKSAGKSPFYIYAGMNMQGGEPRSGSNYDLLKDYQYSIGLWGAHSVNMLWQDRYSNGSSDQAKISTYIKSIEQWFGNGPRNPAIKITPTLNRTHRPNDNWAGMSSMMTARSTLAFDLKTEAFYTFFNIGNGAFLNWRGERQHNNSWHNIGVQDYQPTWHYWFAPEFLGGSSTTISADDVHLNANVTWEDAYMGGSCLKITGSTTKEYLHLFKTKFNITATSKIRLTYKLLGGKADLNFALGNTTASIKECNPASAIFTVDQCEALEDQSYAEGSDGWQVAEFNLPSTRTTLNGTLGMIALRFENAENLELLIGGLELVHSAAAFTQPGQPRITVSKVLAYNVNGVDAKLIWEMGTPIAGEPTYNIDVNTSMFQMWAQQEGEEPVMMGLTTSWAGFVFAAPVNADGNKSMRFGVRALSLDLDESKAGEITWSDYLSLGEYQTIDDITISKNIIKPNESFELSFVDPLHASGTWTITDLNGSELWNGTGISVECPGLDEIGAYNLKLTTNGTTVEYPRYISISSEAVGALPEIYTLSIDGDNVTADGNAVEINVNDVKTFSYTGRAADGSASRGVNLSENWFGVSCGEIGLDANKSFSVAAWIKIDEFPSGLSSFLTIEDRVGGGWPMNNWGYFWSRINDEGRFLYDRIDTAWGWRTDGSADGNRIFYRYDDAKIDAGAWTHVAIVFEYQTGTNKMRSSFYINGKKQLVSAWVAINKGTMEGIVGSTNGEWTNLESVFNRATAYGTDTYTPDYITHSYPVTTNTWITFGGSSQDISAIKGCVDDFQVWGKAMTDEEVEASMNGIDKNNLPADLLGFWDFETEADATTKAFPGVVGSNSTKTAPKAYLYSIVSSGESSNTRSYDQPEYLVGCPFIAGTAFPVVTKPTWSTRRADVDGDGTGESGSAAISWTKAGDYTVELKLANGHGEATMTYPVVKVADETQGIGEISADGQDFATYTVDNALFVEFGADGAYDVDVYNTSGMLVGRKVVSVVAGQNVSITLGQAGVYLVKVARDGQLLRTVKVIRK